MIGTKAFNLVWDFREKTAINTADCADLAKEFWSCVCAVCGSERFINDDEVSSDILVKACTSLIEQIGKKIAENDCRIEELKESMYKQIDDCAIEDRWEYRLIIRLSVKNSELEFDQSALKKAIKVFEA